MLGVREVVLAAFLHDATRCPAHRRTAVPVRTMRLVVQAQEKAHGTQGLRAPTHRKRIATIVVTGVVRWDVLRGIRRPAEAVGVRDLQRVFQQKTGPGRAHARASPEHPAVQVPSVRLVVSAQVRLDPAHGRAHPGEVQLRRVYYYVREPVLFGVPPKTVAR